MCNREAPSVEEATQRWAGKVGFVGVAWQGSEAAMQKFIDKHGLTFPQINDDMATVYGHFDVPAQPAWVFIDASGAASQVLGAMEPSDLDAALTGIAPQE